MSIEHVMFADNNDGNDTKLMRSLIHMSQNKLSKHESTKDSSQHKFTVSSK